MFLVLARTWRVDKPRMLGSGLKEVSSKQHRAGAPGTAMREVLSVRKRSICWWIGCGSMRLALIFSFCLFGIISPHLREPCGRSWPVVRRGHKVIDGGELRVPQLVLRGGGERGNQEVEPDMTREEAEKMMKELEMLRWGITVCTGVRVGAAFMGIQRCRLN